MPAKAEKRADSAKTAAPAVQARPVKKGDRTVCTRTRSLAIVPAPPALRATRPDTYDGAALLPLLNAVGGAGVPATVQLGLGIGTPAGVDCSVTSSVTAGAGTAPQLTGTFGPGLFCVRVYDVGNLPAPASFSVTIAHS